MARRGARVADSDGLENRCPERDRGFESHPLRQPSRRLRLAGQHRRERRLSAEAVSSTIDSIVPFHLELV